MQKKKKNIQVHLSSEKFIYFSCLTPIVKLVY